MHAKLFVAALLPLCLTPAIAGEMTVSLQVGTSRSDVGCQYHARVEEPFAESTTAPSSHCRDMVSAQAFGLGWRFNENFEIRASAYNLGKFTGEMTGDNFQPEVPEVPPDENGNGGVPAIPAVPATEETQVTSETTITAGTLSFHGILPLSRDLSIALSGGIIQSRSEANFEADVRAVSDGSLLRSASGESMTDENTRTWIAGFHVLWNVNRWVDITLNGESIGKVFTLNDKPTKMNFLSAGVTLKF